MAHKKPIDVIQLRKLAMMQCSNREIASFFDVHETTVIKRFSKELAKGRQHGKSKLRKGLWQLAEAGNLGALIWLSKQHLGMSDGGLVPEEPRDSKDSEQLSQIFVDLNDMQKKALMVLAREIAHLLKRSGSRKLEHDEAVLLSNNIRLINELKELKAIDELQNKDQPQDKEKKEDSK